jgi:hypothetical protein
MLWCWPDDKLVEIDNLGKVIKYRKVLVLLNKNNGFGGGA